MYLHVFRVNRAAWTLLILALVFGGYGAVQLREAIEYKTSLRDGIEALIIGFLLFTGAGLTFRWSERRHDREKLRKPDLLE
jgi:hypothetical protein